MLILSMMAGLSVRISADREFDYSSRVGPKPAARRLGKLVRRRERAGKEAGSMNVTRGLFRIWIVAALFWLCGTAWYLRGHLQADCKNLAPLPSEHPTDVLIDCLLGPLEEGWLIHLQTRAIEWMLLPPIGLLVIGALGIWAARGFRGQNSN
jgi:hypothetical protein